MKRLILPLLLCALTIVGCSKNETSADYINTSDNTCSFNIEGGSATIYVDASGSWKAVCDAEWLSVSESSNSLTVTVEDNTYGRERVAYVMITSGATSSSIEIFQVGDPNLPVIYRHAPSDIFSPNGRYLAGITTPIAEDMSDIGEQYVVLLDMSNDETHFIGPFDSKRYSLQEVYAVDDRGDMFIKSDSGLHYFFNVEEGSLTEFISSGSIFDCNSDGTVAVGYITKAGGDGGLHRPVKWVNGVAQELELPETPSRPQYGWDEGACILRGVSSDGKICFGTEWLSVDFFMLYWDANEGNIPHRVGEDVYKVTPVEVTDGNTEGIYYLVQGMMTTSNPECISPSGRWINGYFYQDSIRDDGKLVKNYYPAFYDTEKHKTHIFWDYPDGYAVVTRDDGIGFIRTNARLLEQDDLTMSDYFAVDVEAETTISTTQEWFFDNYGIYPPAKLAPLGFSDDFRIAIFRGSYIVDKR